jgi:hypothetical protein
MADTFGDFVGDGQVLNGQTLIAHVGYAVRFYPTFIEARSTSGGSVPGLPRVECVLIGLHSIGPSQEQLTLVMDDGRRLNFYVVDGSGRVQPTGPIYTPLVPGK